MQMNTFLHCSQASAGLDEISQDRAIVVKTLCILIAFREIRGCELHGTATFFNTMAE